MSAATEVTVQRLEGRRSSGVWAAVAGIGVLAIVLAYFVYSYAYLMVSADRWPPPGIADPPLLRPAVLLAVLALSAVVAVWTGRPLPDRAHHGPVALGLGAIALVGGAVLVAGTDLLADLGLEPRTDAYSAIVTTIHVFHGAVTVAGIVICAVTAYETHRLGRHPWVAAAAAVASAWWCWVVVGWVVVMAVVYLSPQLA